MLHFEGKDSSNIHWARYDQEQNRLEIDFRDSKGNPTSTYEYLNFSYDDWLRFEESKSKGQHFAAAIRNKKNEDGTPKFPHRRIK